MENNSSYELGYAFGIFTNLVEIAANNKLKEHIQEIGFEKYLEETILVIQTFGKFTNYLDQIPELLTAIQNNQASH
ncbi:hypothetical protein [Fictibacillus norfolkensis]|uniref:Uncharacterized protein n=1 Tax=Fictibacillus norfolkensis TaxID=2762233 RepID=A0ABR8SPH9_9BACL|nr:hypothetical protein [Fictibacillus norfolkensis]MBD7965392.1 hypothetical protein [Fictibacillus norfolkensis]